MPKISIYVTEGALEKIVETIEIEGTEDILTWLKRQDAPRGELCYHKKEEKWYLHR